MLSTSSSQYLQPEYIQPLPSSLDVSNSPLALLAQTCSSIGKDTGPSSSKTGSNSSSADKKSSSYSSSSSSSLASGGSGAKDSSGGPRAKSESPPTGRNVTGAEERSKSRTSGNDRKESGQGQRSGGSKGTTPKPGFRVPAAPSKEGSSSAGGDRSNSDSGTGSSVGDSGHGSRESLSLHLPSTAGRTLGHGTIGSSTNGSSTKSTGTGNSCSSMLLELNQEALSKSSLHGSLHPLYSSLKDGLQALHGSLTPSLGALPFLGYPALSLDPLAAAYSASLAAHCSSLAGLAQQKSPAAATGIASTTCAAAASGLPPYVSYARVKTAAGGTTLVPVCKDPYCAHCQVALHGAQLAAAAGTTCAGPGCSQCTQHDKASPTRLASPAPAGLPFYSGAAAAAAASAVAGGLSPAALCSHAAFSSPSALQGSSHHHGGPLVTPYVCNWVQGSEYCGKRFASSDELLQHLRSHTSTASDALVSSPFNAGLPLSAALGFPLGGLLGCPTLSPGLLSAPSYPRSLSPNSLLSAARYHPYKPPSLSMLPGSTPPGLPGAFPSLAAYYSPYAFYGQRIGAAAAAAAAAGP